MANHVHVGVAGRLQDAAIIGCRDAVGKAVEGDHVGAFGKNRDAVDNQLERASPLVGMAVEDDGAEACLGGALFGPMTCDTHLRGELVELLFTVTGGIPELGLTNFDRNIDDVVARMEVNLAGQGDGLAVRRVPRYLHWPGLRWRLGFRPPHRGAPLPC